MPNADLFPDEASKHRYIQCLINIAEVDGYHHRELEYIKSQALLIGISMSKLEQLYQNLPDINSLSIKNIPYELKLLLVRDVYTVAAIDGFLSQEEEDITHQLHLELELDTEEILSIQLWLKRYWSLLQRSVKVKKLPTLNSTKSFTNNQSPSKKDYLMALEKLKSRDKVGVAGELLTSAFSASAGAVSAGTLASIGGASTLLGSSTLGTILGGVFVTSTPIGWVIGCAAGAGALGFGLSKLIASGGKEDAKRKILAEDIKSKILKTSNQCEEVYNEKTNQFNDQLKLSIQLNTLTVINAQRLEKLVLDGKLSVEIALDRLNQLNSTY